MRPALSTPCGSKLWPAPASSTRPAGRARAEDVDSGAHSGRRADQRGMSAGGCDSGAHERRWASLDGGTPPRQGRRPSRRAVRHPPLRQRAADSAPRAGAVEMRRRDRVPDRPLDGNGATSRIARQNARDAASLERRRAGRTAPVASAARPCACATEGDAFEPERRRRAPTPCRRCAPQRHRQVGSADTSATSPIAAAIALRAVASSRLEEQHGPLGLGARQRLDRHVGHGRQRAPRAGQEFARS